MNSSHGDYIDYSAAGAVKISRSIKSICNEYTVNLVGPDAMELLLKWICSRFKTSAEETYSCTV